ncbi:MAG: RNA methyltransferase [Bryobacterales bacterium]|nr:RNA methyltransferase [Bryobacterales bacterium]
MNERVPFQVTRGAERYDALGEIPVSILLDDVRSMYNVGAFFRTADAAAIERLYLCGITAPPTQSAVAKTALGAEQTVRWQHAPQPVALLRQLRASGHQLVALETSPHAVDLFDWKPQFPVCVLFGNEVEGLKPELLSLCDVCVRIPMLGLKHSLNVATAGGVVMYELLRKYRDLVESASGRHLRASNT